MKLFSKMVTVLGLVVVGFMANGEQILDGQKVAINRVSQQCFQTFFSQETFNSEIASGSTVENANKAAFIKSFDRTIFNQAIANGSTVELANALATTYNYRDNSKFCREFRKLVKEQLTHQE